MVKNADELRDAFNRAMSPEEVAFLRDIQGFIEFAVQNGLSMPVVLSTVGHDINCVVRYGSLQDAKADNWVLD